MFPESNFHQILHAWALKHEGKPILHIDIHGKLNRSKDCEIDVGIQSIHQHWPEDPIIKHFTTYF